MSKHIKICGLFLMLIFNLKLAKAENANTNKEESAVFTLVNQFEELNTPTGGGESLGSSECTLTEQEEFEKLIEREEKNLEKEETEFKRDLDLMGNNVIDVDEITMSDSIIFEEGDDGNSSSESTENIYDKFLTTESYTWRLAKNDLYHWSYIQIITIDKYMNSKNVLDKTVRKVLNDGGHSVPHENEIYEITPNRTIFEIENPILYYQFGKSEAKSPVRTAANISVDPKASITGDAEIKFSIAKMFKDLVNVCFGTKVKVEKTLPKKTFFVHGNQPF